MISLRHLRPVQGALSYSTSSFLLAPKAAASTKLINPSHFIAAKPTKAAATKGATKAPAKKAAASKAADEVKAPTKRAASPKAAAPAEPTKAPSKTTKKVSAEKVEPEEAPKKRVRASPAAPTQLKKGVTEEATVKDVSEAKAKKAATTKAQKEGVASYLPLLEKEPTRLVLSKLRAGLTREAKPHWIPIPPSPLSPYSSYFSARASDLGKVWKDMPPEQKAKYEKQAEEDSKRYAKEVAEYFASRTPEQFYRQVIPPNLLNLDPLKVPKLPPNPYSLFVADSAKTFASFSPFHMKKIAEKWNGMTEAEKKPYHEKAEKAQADFQKTWREYKTKIPPFPSSL